MPANVGDLNAFLAVARRQELSRTAPEPMAPAPPALSEAVRRLEGELGVRLLHRTTRSVVADRGGCSPARAARPGARRGGSGARRGERLSRPAGGHAAPQRAGQRGTAGAAGDRAALPRGLPRHPAGGDRGGQLRRRAGRRLRCRHPLRRAAGAGHDRGADRPARAALRHRRLARLSRPARPAGASARPAGPCLPARPLRQRRDAALGIRARRPRWSGSIRRARCWCASARRPISRSTRRSPAPASSSCSRTGCARTSTAARSSPCSSHGGSPFRGRSSIIPAGAWCRRRCGRSSTSSRQRPHG